MGAPHSNLPSPKRYKGGLRRLADAFYQGRCYVHWTMTLHRPVDSWLDTEKHVALRRILFHATAREALCCPVYALMPDHGHFLFIGLAEHSDQRAAVRWLRREWNAVPGSFRLQKQAYDSVLREKDRSRDAFADTVGYILRNPVRKGLVSNWQDWPYSGAIFPGYPSLDPRNDYFWDNFWRAHNLDVQN